MAEVVAELQERLLPEYEQLKKQEICTEAEIKQCIQKRYAFQIKITSSSKEIRHYMEFIEFEKLQHRWLCEKEKALGKNLYGLKMCITRRIIRLYREALKCFPYVYSLWTCFLKFSKKSAPNDVAGIYEKMLNFHADKPMLWCEAAMWTYEFKMNMPKVRDIFLRGLQRHQKSAVLFNALFCVLLQEAAKMDTERNLQDNKLSEQDIGLERVEIVYRKSKEQIKNIEFFLGLIERCEKEEYANMTAKLQKIILDDLMEKYPREELLWHALAQRELRGFNMIDVMHENAIVKAEEKDKEVADTDKLPVTDEENTKPAPGRVWQTRALSRRIQMCYKVYEEAAACLETTKMWTYFIDAMLKLNEDIESEAVLKRKCLAQAFHMGHKAGLLNVEHYVTYVRMLVQAGSKGVEKAEALLQTAVQQHKTAEMYKLWLSTYIHLNKQSKVDEIYKEAKNVLDMQSLLPIAKLMIEYYMTLGDTHTEKLRKLYEYLSMQTYPEFGLFRVEILSFYASKFSLSEARKKYDELCKYPPLCLEMHQEMVRLEEQQMLADSKKRLRLVHENCAYYFGKTNTQVWLDFIKFERDFGEAQRVTLLYKRAVGTLQPGFVQDFITEFNTLTITTKKLIINNILS